MKNVIFQGTEPPISPGHSSDYADQEELLTVPHSVSVFLIYIYLKTLSCK